MRDEPLQDSDFIKVAQEFGAASQECIRLEGKITEFREYLKKANEARENARQRLNTVINPTQAGN